MSCGQIALRELGIKVDKYFASEKGLCSEERSMISTDYARNFICDLIIGKEQVNSEQSLFKDYNK